MINLISLIISKLNLPSVKLTADEILFLKTMVTNNSPVFTNLNNDINTIITDKSINIEQVMQLVLLIVKNYKDFIQPHDLVVEIINLIRFTLDTVLEIFTPDQLLTIPVESVINYGLTLLQTELESKTVITWFDKLKCCC